MVNPIFDESPPYRKIRFNPNEFSLDSNSDGRVDERDFEQSPLPDIDDARERIYAPDPDERSNVRELKKLRAADILAERAKQREEALADRIISEEEKRLQQERKSPIRKGLEKGVATLGDATRNYIDSDPSPPYQHRRPAPRRMVLRQEPAQPGLRSRLDMYGNGLSGGTSINRADSFANQLLPRAQAPVQSRMHQPQGDRLSAFSATVLGTGRVGHKRQQTAIRPQKNQLVTFNKNLMGQLPKKSKKRGRF